MSWRSCGAFLVATVLALMTSLLVGQSFTAAAQSEQLTVRSVMVSIVQGETGANPTADGPEDFFCFRVMTFNLPYDVSRVYTNMPQGAHNITVLASGTVLNQSEYGRETSGSMEGKFFIDVPAAHERTNIFSNTTNTSSGFLAAGSVLSNLTCDSRGLHLSEGTADGLFESALIQVPSAVNVMLANLTVYGSSLSNVTFESSNDQGVTWVLCSNATESVFSSAGASIRVRLHFEGDVPAGYDPVVTSFKVSVKYVLPSTSLLMHISYAWEQEFENGKLQIDLSEVLPYSGDGSYVAMLYLDRGYSAQASGIELTLDSSRAMNDMPDKDLYLNSTPSVEGVRSILVTISKPQTKVPWALYVGTGIFAALLFVGYLYSTKIRKARVTHPASATPVEHPDRGSISVREEALSDRMREELIGTKKDILAQIEGAKLRAAKGELSKEASEKELARLKKEYKSVRNEINRLSRKEAQMASAKEPPTVSADSSFESMIASIARLDEDYDKGRLPEGTYKTLRKDYVSKAASLRAASDVGALEEEKLKLLEAISALDEEHGKGEVPDDVYEDLRASYRSELASVMRKIGQSGRN